MGLKKLAAKLVEYNERLEHGRAHKINTGHVEKILSKLRRKSAELESEITSTKNADKKARLEQKLRIATDQVQRAEWLLNEIS